MCAASGSQRDFLAVELDKWHKGYAAAEVGETEMIK